MGLLPACPYLSEILPQSDCHYYPSMLFIQSAKGSGQGCVSLELFLPARCFGNECAGPRFYSCRRQSKYHHLQPYKTRGWDGSPDLCPPPLSSSVWPHTVSGCHCDSTALSCNFPVMLLFHAKRRQAEIAQLSGSKVSLGSELSYPAPQLRQVRAVGCRVYHLPMD